MAGHDKFVVPACGRPINRQLALTALQLCSSMQHL